MQKPTDYQWFFVARSGLEPPTFPIANRDALTPWVAAGSFSPCYKAFNVLPAFHPLDLALAPKGSLLAVMLLCPRHTPGPIGLGRGGCALVMALKPSWHVLAAAHVVAPIELAFQNVGEVVHTLNSNVCCMSNCMYNKKPPTSLSAVSG